MCRNSILHVIMCARTVYRCMGRAVAISEFDQESVANGDYIYTCCAVSVVFVPLTSQRMRIHSPSSELVCNNHS